MRKLKSLGRLEPSKLVRVVDECTQGSVRVVTVERGANTCRSRDRIRNDHKQVSNRIPTELLAERVPITALASFDCASDLTLTVSRKLSRTSRMLVEADDELWI